ncbi:MAG TPA: hypothetical protein VLC46_16520 [Thermoanaerobaculia bacterium]|nr:hypothetical protein [Thermoanaerobaculia bacterium]
MGESEKAAVENPPCDAIPALNQRGENDSHVPAGIDLQERIDVLNDEPRRPRLFQYSYELKEKAASLAGQTCALARNADVLAWESAREDVDRREISGFSDVAIKSESWVSESG